MVETLPAVRSEGEIAIQIEKDKFDLVQRKAKMLAESKIVPQQYQRNIPDCVIALELSERMGMPVLALMQGTQVIHGKPSFEGKFLKALLDHSGRFTPLSYEFDFNQHGKIVGCTASAKDLRDGKTRSVTITEEIVKAEGWDKPKGGMTSKWVTTPALMYPYRCASWFCKIYAPDLMMGMQSTEELQDMQEVQKVVVTTEPPPAQTPRPLEEVLAEEEVPEKFSTESIPKDDQPQQTTISNTEPEDTRWWLNQKHWIYRKTMDFYLACMVGFGVPFEPHIVKIDGETVEVGESQKAMYHEFSQSNPDAIAGLNDLSEFELQGVRKKFVFSLKIEPGMWNRLHAGYIVEV